MNHRHMADQHILANDRREALGPLGLGAVNMHHRAILDIAARADDDAVDIGAQHAVIPDAGIRTDLYIANNAASRRDEGAGMDARGFAIHGNQADVISHGVHCFFNRWSQRT